MSNNDLISRKALLERIDKYASVTGIGLEPVMTIRDIKQLIAVIQAIDAVSVMRCRYCQSYNTTGCSDGFGWCEKDNHGVYDEWFCPAGEPKEG